MPWRYITGRAQIIRAFYSGIGKSGVIFPASFLATLGEVQLDLGLVFYMREVFRASESTVGWLAGVISLTYMIGCFTVRPLFGRIKPRSLMLATSVLMFLLALSMRFAPSVAWMFALNILRGLTMSLFWPPMMGWLSTDIEGATLNRVMSRFNLSWSLGAILGPALGGWLSQFDVRLPPLVASGIFLFNTAFIGGAMLAMPKFNVDPVAEINGDTPEAVDRSTRLRFPAWICMVVIFFGLGVILTVFPMAAKDHLSFKEGVIGNGLSLRAFFNTAGFMLLGRTVFWHFRRLPLFASVLTAAAVFVALAHVQSFLSVGILLSVYGLCSSFNYTYSLFHGSSGSVNRTRRMAVHEGMLAGGKVLGAAGGGMLYRAAGSITPVYYLTAALLVLSALVSLPLAWWAKRRDAEAAQAA